MVFEGGIHQLKKAASHCCAKSMGKETRSHTKVQESVCCMLLPVTHPRRCTDVNGTTKSSGRSGTTAELRSSKAFCRTSSLRAPLVQFCWELWKLDSNEGSARVREAFLVQLMLSASTFCGQDATDEPGTLMSMRTRHPPCHFFCAHTLHLGDSHGGCTGRMGTFALSALSESCQQPARSCT